MNLESRLQHHYEWTPNYRLVCKKPVPTGLKTFRVPQTIGNLGWIVLTYENSIPVCYWINTHECKKLVCFADERVFGDTILRAEKINDKEYIISDIWLYNSNCVYACSTFSQRYTWLEKFLKIFFQENELGVKFIHKSKIEKYSIRGYEEHPEEIGKHGYFVESDKTQIVSIVKMVIPDCYEVVGKGYLRVPDLKTSVYLRTKGERFNCKCSKYDEEYWDIEENIPEIDVNAP